MAKTNNTKDSAPTPTTALAPVNSAPQMPAHITGNRAGFENVDMQDIMFKRLTLMQDMSPEVKDTKKFSAGDIINRETQEAIFTPGGRPARFGIAFYFKEFVEFGDRNNPQEGVVLNRTLDRKSKLAEECRQWVKKKSSDGKMVRKVQDVHNFIVVFEDRPREPLMLSFARTSAKGGTGLLSLANSLGDVPIYAGLYTLYSEEDRNRRGQTYKVMKAKRTAEVWNADAQLYAICEQMNKQLQKAFDEGRIKTDDLNDDPHDEGDGAPEGADKSKGEF